MTGLVSLYCKNPPSILKLGTAGVFMVCDGTDGLHLRMIPL